MATYIIGDIHGCWQTLESLLKAIPFQPDSDRAVLVGDLVNKGPRSLEILRWAFNHQDSVDAVLGNHDIHLLAATFRENQPFDGDTFSDVLEAPDRDSLLRWLRNRPVMIEIAGHTIVHAGVHPSWSLDVAREHARRLECGIREQNPILFEKKQAPATIDEANGSDGRQKFRLAVFTRIRVVEESGKLLQRFSEGKAGITPGCHPWFEGLDSTWSLQPLIFGHWAALGYHESQMATCIDSGCVWGGSLTAIRLDDGKVWSQKSREHKS